MHFDKILESVRKAATQAGSTTATLFEQFKNSKILHKLGTVMGSLQFKAPVHLINSIIIYAIRVLLCLQDMAGWFLLLFIPNPQTTHTQKHTITQPCAAWCIN